MNNLIAPIIVFVLAVIANVLVHVAHLPDTGIYLFTLLLSGAWLYSEDKINKLEKQVAALQADIIKGHTS